MEHPYKNLEGTAVWLIVDSALADLEENQDLTLTTAREYVVGYLCKSLLKGQPANGDHIDKPLSFG